MKKYLLSLLVVLVSYSSMADSWEDMSMDQAIKVMKYLKRNPFILDYCDCCGNTGELVQVTSSKIIVSPFDISMFSVEVKVKKIASLVRSGDRSINFSTTKAEGVNTFNISMNYTFVYQKSSKLAVCFFNIIDDYENKNSCSVDKSVNFPKLEGVTHLKYSKWYKKKVRK